MQTYTPPAQRDAVADLLTTAGWVTGAFMIPAMRSINDWTNQQHDFFKLKDVKLPGMQATIPFFVLQRRSVVLVIPHAAEQSVKTALAAEKEDKDVSCAFHGGVVSGTLTVPKGLRVSDVALQRDPFFPIAHCTLYLRTGPIPEIRRDIGMILVNRAAILGVSEPRFV